MSMAEMQNAQKMLTIFSFMFAASVPERTKVLSNLSKVLFAIGESHNGCILFTYMYLS